MFSAASAEEWKGPSEATLASARASMRKRVTTVGVLEHIGPWYMLMQHKYGYNASVSCGVKHTHGGASIDQTLWHGHRPAKESVFRADSLRVIRESMHNEYVLWKEALSLQVLQLKAEGMTLAGATHAYRALCAAPPIQ